MPTPYEIYQTYLRGPAAVIRLFEQVFGILALYGPPEPDQQQRTIESQAEPLDHLQARLSRLEHELWEAQQDNHRLRQPHAELEAVISRDSHNSSRPPSSDPPWAKRTRSLRRPSGKSPGGQMGHRGHRHPLTANPARLFVYRPRQCRHCLGPLAGGQIMGSERRQGIEIVPAKLRLIEHRAEVVRCSGCGQRTKGTFPQGVRAALQYGPSVMARALYLHGSARWNGPSPRVRALWWRPSYRSSAGCGARLSSTPTSRDCEWMVALTMCMWRAPHGGPIMDTTHIVGASPFQRSTFCPGIEAPSCMMDGGPTVTTLIADMP